ncbi:MAG: IS66 family transposase [Planctomycetota bacterium]
MADIGKTAEQALAELRVQFDALLAERDSLRVERDDLNAKLDALLKQIYGRRSERYVDDGHPLLPFDEPTDPPPPPHVDEAPDGDDPLEEPRGRKPRKRGAPRLPADLDRVIEDVAPSEAELRCSCCGEPRTIIGYEETEKLEYRPANCYLRVIRRPKLACKAHEEAGVVTPSLPPQVIDKGLAGETMLAQVITAKYRDHLPLYRQAGIYARQGVDIPESTLGDWIRQGSDVLQGVVAAIARQAFASGYVSTDDTKVTLLTKESATGSKPAHLWVYAAEQHGDVMFDFTRGRGGDGPRRVLAGFKGYLQADAYSAYDNLFGSGDIVEVGCMAHARRKFRDALDTAPEFARPAMQAIQALYHVERQCKALELSNDQRFAKRQVESKSTFDALRAWIAELKSRTLPKSPIGKATKYFDRHADALGRFLESGRLEIDNNRCERAMRQVAVGRKNWLFAGSEEGGQRAATLYSLTVSCWELGVDPYAYLSDVLRRVNSTPDAEFATLTPRLWAAARRS